MPTVQLNLRIEASLAHRLSLFAKARQQLPGELVSQAIELLLDAYVPEGNAAITNNALVSAVADLEDRVAALEMVLDSSR
jgi:hypothetical protein